MPRLKMSHLYHTIRMPVVQESQTKTDIFLKKLLAIPFLPFYFILAQISKRNKNLDWVGYQATYLFANLFNFLRGRKSQWYVSYKSKSNHPDAEYENIPAVLSFFKENKLLVILYAFKALSESQQSKLDSLMAEGLVHDFCFINTLPDLKDYINSNNIPIADSRLMITDLSQRPDALSLGFTDQEDENYDSTLSLWSKRPADSEHYHLATQSTTSLFDRAELYTRFANNYIDEILI